MVWAIQKANSGTEPWVVHRGGGRDGRRNVSRTGTGQYCQGTVGPIEMGVGRIRQEQLGLSRYARAIEGRMERKKGVALNVVPGLLQNLLQTASKKAKLHQNQRCYFWPLSSATSNSFKENRNGQESQSGDLKFLALQRACGFDSRPPHHRLSFQLDNAAT